MKKLALIVSAALTTSLALFAGCSSTTGTTADGGTDATATDATTPTDATSDATPADAATPSVCDSLKVCPGDKPAEVAAAKAECLKAEVGKCATEFKAFVKCAAAKTFCDDAGTSDLDPKACESETNALIACSTPAPVDSGADTSVPAVVNGCTTFVDATTNATLRQLTWGFGIATDPNRCLMIKAGQDVTWTGDFGSHPLQSFNGDTPSPIVNAQPGDTDVAAVFATPGVFGYKCSAHASMNGAIKVVP